MHLLVFFIPNQPTVISLFTLLSFLCLFAHPPDCLLLSHPLSHLLPPSLFRSLHLPLLPRVSPLLSHLVPLPSSDLPLFFFSNPVPLCLSPRPQQRSNLFFFSSAVAFFMGFPSESPFPQDSPTFFPLSEQRAPPLCSRLTHHYRAGTRHNAAFSPAPPSPIDG